MKNLSIYFFSGTGNAKKVANWINDKAQSIQLPSSINDLSKIDRKNISPPQEHDILGFISPTHGFNFPPIMLYFIFRFPKTKTKNPLFLINTRAGAKFGKLFLPGLSGVALWLAGIVLLLKGYKIIGLRSIDLPSNWISIHPGLQEKNIIAINERCQKITETFAEDMFANKRNLHAFRDIIQDMLIAPISILYYLVGRFIFAKSFYANSQCNNCGICVKGCPVQAITYVSKRPFWTYNCESCMKCMNLCPKRAIETGHGYIVGLIFLSVSTVTTIGVWNYIGQIIPLQNSSFLPGLLHQILYAIVFLVFLTVFYRLMHYVKRIVVFRQLIEFSSFTKYKFWKRYTFNLKRKK